MRPESSQMLEVVNRVMADQFYIFPDVSYDGMQQTTGLPSGNGIALALDIGNADSLRFHFEDELLYNMVANIVVTESREEWNRQALRSTATEAAELIYGRFLTIYDPKEELSFNRPVQIEHFPDISGARWQQHFICEGNQLIIQYHEEEPL